MSVELEVEEIAKGDYSPENGTVTDVLDQGDAVQITFNNKTVITQPKGSTLTIEQGGRFSHGPTRPASREDLGGGGPL